MKNSIETKIEDALRSVQYPGFSRDIVSFGLIRDIQVEESNATVQLDITTTDSDIPLKIKNSV